MLMYLMQRMLFGTLFSFQAFSIAGSMLEWAVRLTKDFKNIYI